MNLSSTTLLLVSMLLCVFWKTKIDWYLLLIDLLVELGLLLQPLLFQSCLHALHSMTNMGKAV